MRIRRFEDGRVGAAGATWRWLNLNRNCFPSWLAGFAMLSIAVAGQQAPSLNPDRPYLIPEANRLPDKNQQMEMREQQTKQQNFAAANLERKKQIADDSTKLLKLATDLKVEIDKTSKDTLSLNVIRKADEIERLAHSVKEKMKLTIGPG